ncbi:hypothetical protein [Rufibacter latericius]|uniref:STAS/SEC14 domain-containing protein n=1 Tax=Rufibacter latericius TaxID=2487040 RepID=A0A3M9M9Y0_9BACT|nr:hypothetical protein [Rufibacter latericius]RNI22369.1 hypothetical protein EFB08_19850 [Rufibacter latericius]
MDIKELRKTNGDVYFQAYRLPQNEYIFANWIGIQSLETVVMGGNHILSMLRERPCRGLLNCNHELIGPWEVAVPYMALKWVPAASILGLRYFAHVLSPGIFGQRSFASFQGQVKDRMSIKGFILQETAEEWLLRHIAEEAS